jgi:hypothetical protein
MAGYIKSAGIIAAFLFTFFTFPTLAQDVNFSIIPSEVHIENLAPGQSQEFELTIRNKDEVAHNFTITTFPPSEQERREGTTEFPDDNWVSFSSPRIEIDAQSEANVTAMVAIPGDQKRTGGHWETWVAVTVESSDLLSVKLYIRLLVSTGGIRFNAGLAAGIAIGIVLLGYAAYHYFRHRAKRD